MAGLKQSDDESAQLTALTDLCEHLSISTEESLVTFPVEQVVPMLVSAAVWSRHLLATVSGCCLLVRVDSFCTLAWCSVLQTSGCVGGCRSWREAAASCVVHAGATVQAQECC
jgi:hypothetical protein